MVFSPGPLPHPHPYRPWRALGARVAAARVARHCTLSQFAGLVGTKAGTVRLWETRQFRPPRHMLLQLATLLDIPREELTALAGVPRGTVMDGQSPQRRGPRRSQVPRISVTSRASCRGHCSASTVAAVHATDSSSIASSGPAGTNTYDMPHCGQLRSKAGGSASTRRAMTGLPPSVACGAAILRSLDRRMVEEVQQVGGGQVEHLGERPDEGGHRPQAAPCDGLQCRY